MAIEYIIIVIKKSFLRGFQKYKIYEISLKNNKVISYFATDSYFITSYKLFIAGNKLFIAINKNTITLLFFGGILKTLYFWNLLKKLYLITLVINFIATIKKNSKFGIYFSFFFQFFGSDKIQSDKLPLKLLILFFSKILI